MPASVTSTDSESKIMRSGYPSSIQSGRKLRYVGQPLIMDRLPGLLRMTSQLPAPRMPRSQHERISTHACPSSNFTLQTGIPGSKSMQRCFLRGSSIFACFKCLHRTRLSRLMLAVRARSLRCVTCSRAVPRMRNRPCRNSCQGRHRSSSSRLNMLSARRTGQQSTQWYAAQHDRSSCSRASARPGLKPCSIGQLQQRTGAPSAISVGIRMQIRSARRCVSMAAGAGFTNRKVTRIVSFI